MKKCKDCDFFIGGGDWGLCCEVDTGLFYEDTEACADFRLKKD